MLPLPLRKAAILIASLDERTAEALLDQMGPEQAAKVRSALVELEDIPADEEQRVLAEFMRHGSPTAAHSIKADAADVELELSMEPPDDSVPSQVKGNIEPAGSFLTGVAPDQLARVLSSEQPQTIAAVIAHLTPSQSAGVLEHLPPDLATDALERMASLAPLAPAVLADLERELERRLAAVGASPRDEACDKRLSAVIGAMDFRQRERVLLQLSRRNAALVGRLGLCPAAGDLGTTGYEATNFRYRLEQPEVEASTQRAANTAARTIRFTDLVRLSDRALHAVFAAADPNVLLLALIGAEELLVSRILRRLPAKDRAAVRHKLEHPGPVRLREIEQAQAQVAAVANHLARASDGPRTKSPRFAATA